MAYQFRLKLLAKALVHLLAGNAIAAKANTCTTGTISDGAHCIHRQGTSYLSGYCSSVLSITTPTSTSVSTFIITVYEDSTTTTGTRTITGKPVTDTATITNTNNSTITFTDVTTKVTATITSFNATITTTSTNTQYIYTCGDGSSSISASRSVSPSTSRPVSSSPIAISHSSSMPLVTGSSFSSGMPIVTGPVSVPPPISFSSGSRGNLSVSVTTPTYGTGRVASSSVPYHAIIDKRALTTPPCLRHYKIEYGLQGLRGACECFSFPTPAAVTVTVTTVNPSRTITSTIIYDAEATTTVTPTSTKLTTETTTEQLTSTFRTTTSVAQTAYGTFTLTQVVTSVVVTSSPTPTSFNIYYVDSTANSTAPTDNFFQATTAPGGSGIVITNSANADIFALDSQKRLQDLTVGAFIAKNTYDLYPFEILVMSAQSDDTPVCSACNGILQCDYPGTFGNTFALCYGYLALGDPKDFGRDTDGNGVVDCRAIALQYK